MAKIKVNCVYCGNEVERYPSQVLNNVYCSRECRNTYFKINNTITFNCHLCNKLKRVRKANFNNKGNNFCSRVCKDKWQEQGLTGENNPFYGKSHSEETKIKVSKTKKSMNLTKHRAHNYNKRPVKCSVCGKVIFRNRYTLSRNKNNFCSYNCHGVWKSIYYVGENNHRWNPELSDDDRTKRRKHEDYYVFLKEVMLRDNYCCQLCGFYSKWGKGLNVHHLNGYNWDKENRHNPDNGITLCKECHKEFHKAYGYGNNTKEQFDEFLQFKQVNTVVTL